MSEESQLREGTNRALWRPACLHLITLCAAAGVVSCKGQTRPLDFGSLRNATRIEVVTNLRDPVKTIRDPSQIRTAVLFAGSYEDGWSEDVGGPKVPRIQFEFYQGDRYLGGFGVAEDYAVSDPSKSGFLSRDVPRSEIAKLLRQLDVAWPSP